MFIVIFPRQGEPEKLQQNLILHQKGGKKEKKKKNNPLSLTAAQKCLNSILGLKAFGLKGLREDRNV